MDSGEEDEAEDGDPTLLVSGWRDIWLGLLGIDCGGWLLGSVGKAPMEKWLLSIVVLFGTMGGVESNLSGEVGWLINGKIDS